MALDSVQYYRLATDGAELGLQTILFGSPSRAYTNALALWMSAVGTSPFSAVLLNLTCYVVSCALLIAVLQRLPAPWRTQASVVAVVAVSASPMFVFVSTQVLKDAFFLLFMLMLNAGIWWTGWVISVPAFASWRRLVPGFLAVFLGMFVTAGVRSYYPVIAAACLGPMFLAALARTRRPALSLIVGAAFVMAAISIAALLFGSDEGRGYLRMFASARLTSGVGSPLTFVEERRQGFARSGGSTNIVSSPVGSDGMEGRSNDAVGRLRSLGLGLATLVVPLTMLNRLSVVHVSGSTAMMALGDLDTVVFDAVVLASAWLAWSLRRNARVNIPYLVFTVAFAGLLGGLLAYIVTNVGTAVRLRLMLLGPISTLLFAFAVPPALWDQDSLGEKHLSGGVPTRED